MVWQAGWQKSGRLEVGWSRQGNKSDALIRGSISGLKRNLVPWNLREPTRVTLRLLAILDKAPDQLPSEILYAVTEESRGRDPQTVQSSQSLAEEGEKELYLWVWSCWGNPQRDLKLHGRWTNSQGIFVGLILTLCMCVKIP